MKWPWTSRCSSTSRPWQPSRR
ncbi:hypothetical protein LEMLEM_LOCUS5682 [Lemmus lemmus]